MNINMTDTKKVLEYCKRYNSPKVYTTLANSLRKTLLFVIKIATIVFAVYFAGIIYFAVGMVGEMHISPNGIEYNTVKEGNFRDGIVWYIDHTKYELDIRNYEYKPSDYKNGDRFQVYLDSEHKVVDIAPYSSKLDATNKFLLWSVVGFFIIILLTIYSTIWIYTSKSRRNPREPFNRYIKNLKYDINEYDYIP